MKKFKLLIYSLVAMMLSYGAEATAQQAARSQAVGRGMVSIDGKRYYVHTVEAGETLYSLSRFYSVDQQEILDRNPHAVEGFQPGQLLIIPVREQQPLTPKQQAKTFELHIVNQGETAYSICRRYGITVDQLMEDNPGLDPTALSLEQTLNIRKTAVGKSSEEAVNQSIKQYGDAMNNLSTGFVYHTVEKGETLYSLCRYYGLTDKDVAAYNEIAGGLREGQILRLPAAKVKQELISQLPDSPPRSQFPTEHEAYDSLNHPQTGPADNVEYTSGAAETPRRDPDHVNVAMFIPFSTDSAVSQNFMDFYKGSLLAFADLKEQGLSVDVNVYNETRSLAEIENIVAAPDFARNELIIGPVYENVLGPALRVASERGIPVVSPLATVERHQSPLIYQMAPQNSSKYDKLRELLSGDDKNVITVTSPNNDIEFQRDIIGLIPQDASSVTYVRKMASTEIEKVMSRVKENVFVFYPGDEMAVDEMLARISSIKNSWTARGIKTPGISVIGSSRWQRFGNIDRSLFFKLRLNYIASYHADRGNELVAAFNKRYISSYNSVPSLYSYRGYDAVKLFVSSYAADDRGDLASAVNRSKEELLAVPYHFVRNNGDPNSNCVNNEWVLVSYNDDYTITVK
ncbi:MAG: LysM peptidoglycan-binding domain-containing protein [Rikenellaceae bacterium]|jgi:LysM repeat protein|nr:LysM peptidoglycan-binding domain-containing protein [Rikenellaceae bacterium]